MLKLYNTMGRKKEKFVPLNGKKVGMYVCGPTVYDNAHLGHARAAVAFDIIRRWLEYKGYKVTYVSNYTDVDDKMIKRAKEEKVTIYELAEKFIKSYEEDMEALNVKPPDIKPRATKHIPQIIALVKRIIANGYAYVVDGSVYFEVSKFKNYGKLSGQPLEKLISGARVEIDKNKKHPEDFALWKAAKEGEPSWDSPWGRGRPGWHIECSAMSMHYLGETFDIHGGGKDLIFPHHENEIAQSEAATEKLFVKYWLHNGFITIKKEKMSKSLKNFFTVKELLKKYRPEILRFFLISAHYRSDIDFSETSIEDARSKIEKLKNILFVLDDALKNRPQKDEIGESEKKFREEMEKFVKNFEDAMDDDFNTPLAIAHLFAFVRLCNIYLTSQKTNKELIKDALATINKILNRLGFSFSKKSLPLPLEEIEKLVSEREEARKKKNFERADAIRKELRKKGILLEDTAHGVRWKIE